MWLRPRHLRSRILKIVSALLVPKMAAPSQIQELVALLPGGTYITFTVLSQLTTNSTDMAARILTAPCNCSDFDADVCTSRYVCGLGYYELTYALVVITAFIILVLGWFGVDLQKKKARVKRKKDTLETKRDSITRDNPAAAAAAYAASGAAKKEALDAANKEAAKLRRRQGELFMHQLIRAVGGTVVLLVLAIFTPPVSTCLLPPCKVPAVVQQCVPLLVSFAVSAFVVVNDRFVRAIVDGFDYLLHHDRNWTKADLRQFFSRLLCIGDTAAPDTAASDTVAPDTAVPGTAAPNSATNGEAQTNGSTDAV